MTYKEKAVLLDDLRLEYEKYLFDRFGTKKEYNVIKVIEHDFLTQFMDIHKVELLRIGTISEDSIFSKTNNEIIAMKNYYLKNPDIIKSI